MLPCFGYNDLHIYTNNTTFKFNVIINFYIFILVLLAFLNITGYIVSRIENSETCCENCIASVCAFEPIVAEYTALVRLKEFKIGCLKYVTENVLNFSSGWKKLSENIGLLKLTARSFFVNFPLLRLASY